jgi:hypothetical protein
MVGCLKGNELEKIWKEAVTSQFKVLRSHFAGVTEEKELDGVSRNGMGQCEQDSYGSG